MLMQVGDCDALCNVAKAVGVLVVIMFALIWLANTII